MNHLVLIWLALVGGSVLMGASIVALLISERMLEPVSAVSILLGFAAAAWGFGQITTSYSGLDAVGYALFFGAAAVAGGYALASTLLAHLALRPIIPSLPDVLPLGDTTPAVVLLSELEPASYSARATAAALDDLAEEGLLEASMWVLPFLFMAQKTRYRAAGGTSPGPRELTGVAERLTLSLRPRGITHVETAACEGPHALSILVAAAARRGSRTIVVAEAFIAESIEVDRAKRAVDALRLEERGVTVSYTDPLGGSPLCASLVAAKTLAVAGDKASCGVVLVGQAQPVERSRIADTFDLQESGFLNQIRMLLIERGISEQRVHIAWADWRSPEVTGSVRHLAAQGCRTVVVVPACFPLDSITTMLDLPLSVRQARVDQSVQVLTLRAWHDDPGLVEALRERVLTALEMTDSNAAAALRTSPRSAPSSTNASA
jgi:sirohydrochlorin ferrochelatase